MIEGIKSLRFVRAIAVALLTVFAATTGKGEADIMLAIIGSDETREASDLLLASLSGRNFAEFVEREEIDRILGEQRLSLSSENSALQLGHLLGADGLILAERSMENGSAFVDFRLVAVRPGAVLDLVRIPWPFPDGTEWINRVENDWTPLLPKLKVLEKEAIPVSILNLRSALASNLSAKTDRMLTLLLGSRLASEPRIFVLERRRMELLAGEKAISFDESPFWSGSYLLDGTIDGQSFSNAEITISARLLRPDGLEVTPVEVRGPRDDISEVADELARVILESLLDSPPAFEWNPREEGERYLGEAGWSLRWGLKREAQEASEAAWALGIRGSEAAAARVRAYSPTPAKASDVFRLRTHGTSSGSWHYMDGLTPPDDDLLADAIMAMRYYRTFSENFELEQPEPAAEWFKVGVATLADVSMLLQHYHFFPAAQESRKQELAETRELARSLANLLGNMGSSSEALSTELFGSKVKWGHFWQEKPEDVLALLEQLIADKRYPSMRGSLHDRDAWNPFLPAWNLRDASRGPVLWSEFLHRISESEAPPRRLEGRILAVATSALTPWVPKSRATQEELQDIFHAGDTVRLPREGAVRDTYGARATDQELEKAFDAFAAEVEASYNYLIEGATDRNLSAALSSFGRLASGRMTPAKERVQNKIHKLSRRIFALPDERREHADRFARDAAFRQQLISLRAKEAMNAETFRKTFPDHDWEPEQIAQMRPLIRDYKATLEARRKSAAGDEALRLTAALRLLSSKERYFDVLLRRREERNATVSAPPPDRAVPAPDADKAETAALRLERFLELPLESVGLVSGGETRLESYYLADNIVHAIFMYSEPSRRGALVGFWTRLFATFDFKKEEWTLQRMTMESTPPRHTRNLFVVAGDSLLYRSRRDTMRWRFGQTRVERFELPLEGPLSFFRAGDRVLTTSKHNIAEILPEGSAMNLLASTRRRPPVSSLDALPEFQNAAVIPGKGAKIRIFVNDTLYEENGKDWEAVFSFPRFTSAETGARATFFFLRDRRSAWILPHGMEQPRLLYELQPNTLPRPDRTPYWSTPITLTEIIQPYAAMAMGSEGIYIFQEHLEVSFSENGPRVEMKDRRHANLVYIEGIDGPPQVIPIVFTTPPEPRGLSSPSQQPGFIPSGSWRSDPPYHLIIGDKNLILLGGTANGCWTLPLDEIEVYRENKHR